MEDLNNVPSSGTYGAAINEVNANFSLIVNAINSLEYATTKSKGIYNNGFTPNTTTLPNSVSGDWCMVLGTGNTFPARIWTFNGTTWAQGGTWNPDGINLNDYATTSALNTAVANSLLQATARMGYCEATISNTAIEATLQGYLLPSTPSTGGGNVRIKMPSKASVSGTYTLNINSTGAKEIMYNGLAVSPTNTWDINEVVVVYYTNNKYWAKTDGGVKTDTYPTANSKNAVSSGGVYSTTPSIGESSDGDFEIADELGNVILRLKNGHVITKNFNSQEIKTDIEVETSSDTDIDFSDEQGNVVMRVANGHVKTKNFDSSNITINSDILNFVKNKYQGLRCAIVGDSISSYSGTSPSGYQERYPDGDVTNVNQMWWKIVCDTLGMTPTNCSWRGSRVSGAPKGNAYAACSDARVTDIGRNGAPDIVIFFIGCNDWGSNTEPTAVYGTWSVDDAIVDDSNYTSTQRVDDIGAAYALMLSKTQKAYPHAKLFCCTITDEYLRDFDGEEKQEPPQYPPINKRGVSNFTWNRKLKDVMEALGATCINVHDCGMNFYNLVNYVTDDTGTQGTALHPNKAGMKLIANKVISALLAG